MEKVDGIFLLDCRMRSCKIASMNSTEKFIDHLVNYAIKKYYCDELYPISHDFMPSESQLTFNVAKLVCFRCKTFSGEVCEVVAKCKKAKFVDEASKHVCNMLLKYASQFLTSFNPNLYFYFFSIICELCIQLSASEVNCLVLEVKRMSAIIVNKYSIWLSYSEFRKLDSFAKDLILEENSAMNFNKFYGFESREKFA